MIQNACASKREWAPLVVRLTLGFYLLLVGLFGIQDAEITKGALETYLGTSGLRVDLFSYVVPYLLLIGSVLILCGFLTTFAAILTGAVIAILLILGGAFTLAGEGLPAYVAKRSMFKDMALLGAALSLVFSGPGKLSLDALFGAIYNSKNAAAT